MPSTRCPVPLPFVSEKALFVFDFPHFNPFQTFIPSFFIYRSAPAAATPVVAPKLEKKQFGGIRVLPTGTAPAHSTTSSSSAPPSPEPAPRSHQASLEREYSVPPGPEEDDGPVLP